VLDFCRRVSTRKVNKKVLEALTLAGGFDSIGEVNRPSLIASIEGLLSFAGEEQQERELGQDSLFDSFNGDEVKLASLSPLSIFKKEEDWPRSKKLANEKQVVGFYVSGHPMDTWQRICEDWLGWSITRIKKYSAEKAAAKSAAPAAPDDSGGYGPGPGRYRAPKTEVKLGGLLTSYREQMTRKGTRMAFGEFEDLNGKIEIVIFPDVYAQLADFLKKAVSESEATLLTGEIEVGEETPKILVKSIEWAEDAHRNRVQQVTVTLHVSQISQAQLRELKKSFLQFRGKCPVRIDFVDPKFKTRLELPKNVCVSPTPAMVEAINKIFGGSVVALR
jgi:DNA polymerase-3 subunit alpha